jgi:hypothetical protein
MYAAGKIEQHERNVVAIDVEADGEAAVGIDHELGRRLPARAQHAAGREYQAILQQPAGDIGDRCRRQARLLRQRRPGYGTVHSNRMQGHALIVIAGPFEIAAR